MCDPGGGELVEMGSAGAKAMAVVRGEVDCYVHSGGQFEWDNCAPAAVALAAGLHASRIDGSPSPTTTPTRSCLTRLSAGSNWPRLCWLPWPVPERGQGHARCHRPLHRRLRRPPNGPSSRGGSPLMVKADGFRGGACRRRRL
ncbi:MAG: hypothetical protein Ct9H300mP12_02080 [Acidimicrobiales bacterium]|nr:MAG: hypothetical protein Ct9H300mP12_02080 [Acidimicrobiales bacterium]